MGSLTVRSSNLMSAEAIATGVAGTTAGGDAIGIGVAINIAEAQNEASVGAGATVSADGAIIEATMADRDVDLTVESVNVIDAGAGGAADPDHEKIFLGAGHGLTTGEKVKYKKGDGGNTEIDGLTDGTDYYARVLDGGYVQLYDTEEHAKAGGATGLVNLTGAGTGAGHKFEHGGIPHPGILTGGVPLQRDVRGRCEEPPAASSGGGRDAHSPVSRERFFRYLERTADPLLLLAGDTLKGKS